MLYNYEDEMFPFRVVSLKTAVNSRKNGRKIVYHYFKILILECKILMTCLLRDEYWWDSGAEKQTDVSFQTVFRS